MSSPNREDHTAFASAPPLYATRAIRGVYTFVKPAADPSVPPLRVQCIVPRRAPVHVIFNYHSTCVMNVISYEKAYSLYPRASIHGHRSLVTCAYPSRGQPAALEKYADRGFSIETTIGVDDPDFPVGKRYFGDGHCWSLSLDMSGVEVNWAVNDVSSPLTQDPVAATSWSLKINSDPESYPVELVTKTGQHPDHLVFYYTAYSWKPLYFARQMVEKETGLNLLLRSKVPAASRRYYDQKFTEYVQLYYRLHDMGCKIKKPSWQGGSSDNWFSDFLSPLGHVSQSSLQ
ncbi:hypothetical protein EIP91_010304 [Steccherinum ochraceum]|uniref:Uncharacterized protein n=1 Tax=Steccherinum ochraceum TaxID=92696 RepID=A0A4R0RSZ5_9APHY|nr:hypothetical protein EIP91_010304 [Steccherinum ochraceum]